MSGGTIAIIVIVAILVIAVGYIWSTQRSLVALDEKMKNAFGQINVQLKTRWDAVTNLVEMTKQYTKHEHDTLTDVIAQRRNDNATPEQMADQENAIQTVLSRLNAVAEAYPQGERHVQGHHGRNPPVRRERPAQQDGLQ